MADFQATLTNTSVSPQKMRLVVDLVRGKSAQQAVDILAFTPSKAAQPLLKLLKSAVANAAKNGGVAIEQLYVHAITADGAPTRGWRRFGARGRFKPLIRRSSHVTVTLRQREGVPLEPAAPRPERAAKPADQAEAKLAKGKAAKAKKQEK